MTGRAIHRRPRLEVFKHRSGRPPVSRNTRWSTTAEWISLSGHKTVELRPCLRHREK